MGKVIAVANQKGGVGKTTTSINLSAALAQKGQKVLIVDCDPQGNATTGLGFRKGTFDSEEDLTSYDLMTDDARVEDCIKETKLENLKLIPSEQNLSGAESEIINKDGRNFILREKLQGIKNEYDFILIDCPPSLTVLTINALTAADSVLIPIQCEYYALEGLSQLTSTITLTKNRLNDELAVEGVVFTMYDARTNLSQEVMDEVKKNLNEYIFETPIPRNVKLAEAPSYGEPICIYDPKSPGSIAYNQLAEELMKKNGKKNLTLKGLGENSSKNKPKKAEEISTENTEKSKENEEKKQSSRTTSRTAGKVTKSGTSRRAARKTIMQNKKASE